MVVNSVAGAIIIDIVCGIDLNSSEGAVSFNTIEKATAILSEYVSAGSFLGEQSTSTTLYVVKFISLCVVDLFPVREYVHVHNLKDLEVTIEQYIIYRSGFPVLNSNKRVAASNRSDVLEALRKG